MNMVLFFDGESQTVIRIPASELRSGAMRTKMEGYDEPVWALPQEGTLMSDPDFDFLWEEELPKIQQAFAEYRPLSEAEWRDQILNEENPDEAFGNWARAAEVFTAFANDPDVTSAQRDEAFRLLVLAITMSPAVSETSFHLSTLSQETAHRIIRSYRDSFDSPPLT